MNDEMVTRFASLYPHERSALIAALRRDANALLFKAGTDSTNADYYRFNYRLTIRLLDVLAPANAITE